MKTNTSILIVGVGGQGVVLAGELLCDTAFLAGMDVKKSEVHGMAQRGGVVSSHVRMGEKIYSPLIPVGGADLLLSFEQAEALRWIHFVKSDGCVIVNTRKLIPPVAFLKGYNYPSDPIGDVRQRQVHVVEVPAGEMAESLGNARAENIVLLGTLSRFIPMDEKQWEQAIRDRVPKDTEILNIRAFHAGRSLSS